MSKYSFSQLIRAILSQIQGARAQVYNILQARATQDLDKITLPFQGGPTLADFFVVPPQGSTNYDFVGTPRNQTQGRFLQLLRTSI